MTESLLDWPGNTPWQPLPEAARRCFRLSSAIAGAVFGLAFGSIPAAALAFADGPAWWHLGMAVGVLAACLALALWRATLVFRYTRWQLDGDGLRVRRGRFWRSEVLVPRARVQHLDIERGPIERRYGLATLVVHTAGTRLSAVRQPGFDEESATQLRDALVPRQREHDEPAHG